jgi:hypothetical protein
MRLALWATAVMNVAAAFAITPMVTSARELLGLPGNVHPIYLWIIAQFVLIFGLGYGWCAYTGRAPRFFITLTGGGKLAFFALLVAYWQAGDVPLDAVVAGSGDLVFASLFFLWLYRMRGAKTP